VRQVPVTGSTNADLSALAAAGEAAGLVLVAGEQTAGRGRLGRAWVAPAGTALTFSVLLRPAVPASRLGWLPLVCGLAVTDAVRDVSGLQVGLKWPNDVLAGERKLGGILVERVGGTDAAVAGIGLNVAMTADQLPVTAATSLAVELGPAAVPSLEELLTEVLDRLAYRLAAWESGADQSADYRAACRTLGRPVRVEMPAGPSLAGTTLDVDADGRLLVDTGTEVVAVAAGDVVHVR
jgi:BirA family transcriptional regulator, biotin operon repressor / biotin---[acetyl-CoA-carboxylase] ligase